MSEVRNGLYHRVYSDSAGYLGMEGVRQIQFVNKPLQNLTMAELDNLESAQTLLSSPSDHSGHSVNAYEGTRYISVLASQSRNRYFVYAAHGNSSNLDLGTEARTGSFR